MMAPLYKLGSFDFDVSLLVALVIGMAFGFFLERGGLGNARKLAAQFYLTDLTVFKVMFTAVVTAMLGLYWFARLGILDLSLVFVNPTYLLPQLLAGLIFGVGFVMGGLCPGTTLVASVTGKLDGLVVLLGILAGIYIFGETFSTFTGFFYASSLGNPTLPQLLHLPHGAVVLLVVLVAVVGFAAAESVEKKELFSSKVMFWKGISTRISFHQQLALLAVIPALLAALSGNPMRAEAESLEAGTPLVVQGDTVATIAPRELAQWIMDKRSDFELIDLRSARSFRRYHLPYARHIPPEVLGEATGLQGVKVVVYARNAALPEEAWLVLKQIGVEGAYYLEGGLDGWRRRILFPNLTSIVGMTEEEVEAVQRISRYFGGRPIGMEKAGASSAGKYRREGC